MNITEKLVKSAVAKYLNIDEKERKIDWFDVLDLINLIEKQQKVINQLKSWF